MITLKNVTLRRGSKVLLDGVSATINPGEQVGLVGAAVRRRIAWIVRALRHRHGADLDNQVKELDCFRSDLAQVSDGPNLVCQYRFPAECFAQAGHGFIVLCLTLQPHFARIQAQDAVFVQARLLAQGVQTVGAMPA